MNEQKLQMYVQSCGHSGREGGGFRSEVEDSEGSAKLQNAISVPQSLLAFRCSTAVSESSSEQMFRLRECRGAFTGAIGVCTGTTDL